MDYDKAISILRGSNILAEGRKLEYGMGKIRIHSRYELLGHFITKALVSFKIYQKGDAFMSEAECRNGRILDILQVTKKKNLVGYEIESKHNGKIDVPGVDIVEIPLAEMPKSAREGLKSLEQWLKQYMV